MDINEAKEKASKLQSYIENGKGIKIRAIIPAPVDYDIASYITALLYNSIEKVLEQFSNNNFGILVIYSNKEFNTIIYDWFQDIFPGVNIDSA